LTKITFWENLSKINLQKNENSSIKRNSRSFVEQEVV